MSPARPPRPWWKPRASRRPQRWALLIVAVTVLVGALVVHAEYRRVRDYPERAGTGTSEPIELEIPSGASFPDVLALLVREGVLPEDEAVYFKLFVLHEGAARKTTAGPHVFRGDMTPTEILTEMQRRQRAEEIRVTVPEGKHMLEVAKILGEAGLGTASQFETAMRDPALVEKLGIVGETVDGYLFPDTYKFRRESTPAEIIAKMVGRHNQVYADLRRRHRDAAQVLERALGFDDRKIVILASIVEKETGARHERPIIAGVFLNRLRFSSFHPKLLQTDPTIIYGCTVPTEKSEACQQFAGRIRRIHLRDPDNPYNTYTHEGLPPGPITNPGRDALEAVFAPKKSRYLYFVARNDGTHQFSKSVSEHEAAVELYQRQGKVGDGSAPQLPEE